MKQFALLLFTGFYLSIMAEAQDGAAPSLPVKVHHAEPLFNDLIRDLGARRGEREWNMGWGMDKLPGYIAHNGFVEYEFAPVNRLGLELELPFSFYKPAGNEAAGKDIPRNRVEGVKVAAQYTFLVQPQQQLSMAIGYQHTFRLHSFTTMHTDKAIWKGHSLYPFIVVAKRWGRQWHTLLFSGPEQEYTNGTLTPETTYHVNTSIHYQLPGGHFAGLEINQVYEPYRTSTVLHPQMKLVFSEYLSVGLVTRIPIGPGENGAGMLARLIYTPAARK